jgi:hypothetical protein
MYGVYGMELWDRAVLQCIAAFRCRFYCRVERKITEFIQEFLDLNLEGVTLINYA